MKSSHVFLAFLCFLFIGCQEETDNAKDVSGPSDGYRDSSLYFIMKKFSLPYSENLRLDSNSLVFYGTRTFDTSFLIHLKQRGAEIKGVYYEILPTYHNSVNDFAIEENQLLHFEGYSFTLDSTKWKVIKSRAEELLANDTTLNKSEGCRDCKEYVLSYNFKSKISNGGKYESFFKFLKDLFLENFIQKRKPIMYKAK